VKATAHLIFHSFETKFSGTVAHASWKLFKKNPNHLFNIFSTTGCPDLHT